MSLFSHLPWNTRPPSAPFVAADEKLIDVFSAHWIKYAAPTMIYLLLGSVSAVLFMAAGFTADVSSVIAIVLFLAALILLTIVHHWFFHKILGEGMVDVIITSKRLIFLQDRLWFTDDMHEVKLDTIRAVEAHKHGFLQNFFRYGELWFDTGGSDVKHGRIIPLIPHPHSKAKEILNILKHR